jgi:hypothetical protein
MSQIAKLHAKVETSLPMNLLLPSVLAANTLLLFGLDAQAAIPRWIKLFATIFLSF